MSLDERVAVLEERSENDKTLLLNIDKKVSELSEQFLKQKGFLGGVIFASSAVWGVLVIGSGFLIKHWK